MVKLNFTCLHDGCCSKTKGSKGYCTKHYQQFLRYGKTLKITCKDFNEVVDKGAYLELILTDVNVKETGRAKIDKEDLAKVKSVGRWSLTVDGYVYNGTKNVLMHRFIMKAKDAEEIDHVDTGFSSKSDNRKKNLRICDTQQNSFNRGKRKNANSRFKGVYPKNQGWAARIYLNNKNLYLGLFKTEKEAANAYNKAAKNAHGNFLHSSCRSTQFYYAPGRYRERALAA